jgi:flavorubredoxin
MEIRPGIQWVVVYDRSTVLFAGLWPIARSGISQGSYLILSERSALVNVSAAATGEIFLDRLCERIDPADLDYVTW